MSSISKLKIIIAGGREFSDYNLVKKEFLLFLQENGLTTDDVIVVSGRCRGADRLGEGVADELGISKQEFPADWGRLGRKAGPIRNAKMVAHADGLLAFWDGKSRGTKDTIELAAAKGIIMKVVRVRY